VVSSITKQNRDTDPESFTVERLTVRDGEQIAFVHEGVGGLPLVLIHGWPGTKRLWWRNIRPLADAGFEVIVPDARGFGESSVPTDRTRYADIASSARDVKEILDSLGHTQCVAAGGDWGSGVVQDLSLRFPGLVLRQIVFNGLAPLLTETYEKAGIFGVQLEEVNEVTDHMRRHSLEADNLLAELSTPQQRHQYVKDFFTGREWGKDGRSRTHVGPGNFDDEAAEFMAEPFDDAAVFRASLGYYEAAAIPELEPEASRLAEPNPATLTLILYGMLDEIVGVKFARRMEIACTNRVGPYLIEGSGHFLQWERADTFNRAVISFCGDLLVAPTKGLG
jgi:pimeloyl-ACP methyl ester carboxylesterase